jgi:hypothetical protein
MQLSSSSRLHVCDETLVPAEVCSLAGALMPMSGFVTRSSGVVGSEEQAERLAELSDWARRLNRPEQADRFLLLAWLALDSGTSETA